jgi:predicted acylesterase/phospholipase RssA/uncharacterized membrane protein
MSTKTSSNSHNITKEIRFAVVMYGGISLAIYMNGIAQELLSLVTSTANDAEKKGTASVYKEIAEYLSELTPAFGHKFVVDIISGTSAGGINGICLAKGLVRGLDNLKVLEKIWLDEGNIDTLLNDRESDLDRYPSKMPKSSLFNSQRMYAKLLGAFQDMEKDAKTTASPHISSMDLFVTATDLRGVQSTVRLSDGEAYEHIHKHVFPFRYREDASIRNSSLNHFLGEFDPMLAFAARSTSSIPPAFEPVKISEILSYLKENHYKDYQIFTSKLEEWKSCFFKKYICTNENEQNGITLNEREFSDGGYLDNRPFGHAINAIHARQADCPIERKLLYIDPSPEQKDGPESKKEISFVKNLSLGLTLPSYETIREELKALQKRNEWIKKVRHILEDKLTSHNREHLKRRLEQEFFTTPISRGLSEQLFSIPIAAISESAEQRITPEESAVKKFWKYFVNPTKRESPDTEKKDFNSMQEALGDAYPAYHYTRLDLLTDQLALMIASAGMADENSALFQNIRENLKQWRSTHYHSVKGDVSDAGDMKTENMFFREFDIDFRIRRLSYFRKTLEKAIAHENVEYLCFGLLNKATGINVSNKKWSNDFTTAINDLYEEIGTNLNSYYLLREQLTSFGKENHLFQKLKEVVLNNTGVHSTSETSPEVLYEKIKSFFGQEYNLSPEGNRCKNSFDAVMNALHNFIEDKGQQHQYGTTQATGLLQNAFSKLGKNYPEIAGRFRFMYDYGYDLYDATTFQLLAGGEYGEGNVVDIFRISPADVPSLWNESEKKRSKLAGTALSAFGGFLDREWRRNDIMWGRLDAAERVITALLPDKSPAKQNDDDTAYHEKRKEFILKAQEIIIRETLHDWLAELDSTRFTSTKDEEQYQRLLSIKKSIDVFGHNKTENGEPEWKQKFMAAYDVHRDFEPEPNLRRLGRSSGVLSSMIDRVDSGKGGTQKVVGYLKKLNWILLGLLDFSTPKTMRSVLLGYWMQILVLVSAMVIGIGVFLNGSSGYTTTLGATLINFGAALLCFDIVVWLGRQTLVNLIQKIRCKSWIKRFLRFGIGIVALILLIGLMVLYQMMQNY